MTRTSTLTIRVDQDTKDRLEAAAARQKRSKAFLVTQAIDEYLRAQEWQEARIREALASVERGEGVSHDAVMSWISAWGTDDERTMPTA